MITSELESLHRIVSWNRLQCLSILAHILAVGHGDRTDHNQLKKSGKTVNKGLKVKFQFAHYDLCQTVFLTVWKLSYTQIYQNSGLWLTTTLTLARKQKLNFLIFFFLCWRYPQPDLIKFRKRFNLCHWLRCSLSWRGPLYFRWDR